MNGVKNADITLYHKEYDPAQRKDVWSLRQYPGVSYHGKTAVQLGKGGAAQADQYTVRIYTDAVIIVAVGDLVVRGLVTEECVSATALQQSYGGFVVSGSADNRRGRLPHWRIEGA